MTWMAGAWMAALSCTLPVFRVHEARPDPASFPVLLQDARSLDELRRDLREGDAKQRRRAAFALWALRVDMRPAVGDLAAALGDEDAYVADVAGRTLRRIGTWAIPVLDAVADTLSDERPAVRRNAVEILLNCREASVSAAPQAVEALGGDGDAVVRTRAALLMGVLAPRLAGSSFGPQVVAALGDALSDASPEVRAQAASAIGSYGTAGAAAFEGLLEGTQDPAGGVRAACLAALGAVGAPAGPALQAAVRGLDDAEIAVRVAALPLLVALDPRHPRIDVFCVRGLRSPSPLLRREAARALGRGDLQPGEATAALREALRDPDAVVRDLAGAALGGEASPSEETLDALVAAVRDPVPRVRVSAARALARSGRAAARAESVLGAMARGARDSDSRRAALDALRSIAGDGR